MGQTSIPTFNKSGYSMFWGFMWDNKIQYRKNLSESLFLDNFFNFLMNDNISYKIIKTKKFKKFKLTNNKIYYNNKSSLIKQSNSKVWIFKYQKWIIVYMFIYVFKHTINKFNNSFKSFLKINFYSNVYKNYLKSINLNNLNSYNDKVIIF